jgi:hypothetical protein
MLFDACVVDRFEVDQCDILCWDSWRPAIMIDLMSGTGRCICAASARVHHCCFLLRGVIGVARALR